MSFVSYQEIQHLVDHAERDNSRMRCWFKCPVSGVVVEETGSLPNNIRNRVHKDAADSLIRQLAQLLTNLIRKYTGLYFNFGASANAAGGSVSSYSEADMQLAIVAAFEKLAVYPGKPVEPRKFNQVDGAWTYNA